MCSARCVAARGDGVHESVQGWDFYVVFFAQRVGVVIAERGDFGFCCDGVEKGAGGPDGVCVHALDEFGVVERSGVEWSGDCGGAAELAALFGACSKISAGGAVPEGFVLSDDSVARGFGARAGEEESKVVVA